MWIRPHTCMGSLEMKTKMVVIKIIITSYRFLSDDFKKQYAGAAQRTALSQSAWAPGLGSAPYQGCD